MLRTVFESDHDLFRESVEGFLEREILPHAETWDQAGIVPKSMFRRAGSAGLLGMAVPDEYGGGGVDDFRYNSVINEVFSASGASAAGMSIILHNDVCLPYFLEYCNDDQRSRWFGGLASGAVSYTHLTLPTNVSMCRSRWSPYH